MSLMAIDAFPELADLPLQIYMQAQHFGGCQRLIQPFCVLTRSARDVTGPWRPFLGARGCRLSLGLIHFPVIRRGHRDGDYLCPGESTAWRIQRGGASTCTFPVIIRETGRTPAAVPEPLPN